MLVLSSTYNRDNIRPALFIEQFCDHQEKRGKNIILKDLKHQLYVFVFSVDNRCLYNDSHNFDPP
jgi:hypothetical protein